MTDDHDTTFEVPLQRLADAVEGLEVGGTYLFAEPAIVATGSKALCQC